MVHVDPVPDDDEQNPLQSRSLLLNCRPSEAPSSCQAEVTKYGSVPAFFTSGRSWRNSPRTAEQGSGLRSNIHSVPMHMIGLLGVPC